MAAQHDRTIRDAVIMAYALTGNASKAAREHGVHERTAMRWVQDALSGKDERSAQVLTDVGGDLRAQAIDSVRRTMLAGVRKAQERIENDAYALDFKSDPTPQYMSAVTQAHRELRETERLALEREGKMPQQSASVVFVMQDVDDEEDESDTADES